MKEVNFFVTGEASASVGTSKKMSLDGMKKSEQLTENESGSFRSILSESILSAMLSISLPDSEKVGEENAAMEKLMEEMDDIMTLQLAMLNELQEWHNMQTDAADTKELPEEYFHILEEVMAMMSLLSNLEGNIPGKVDKQLIQPFTQLSEKVMSFMKSYMTPMDEKTDLQIPSKEKSNIQDLLKAINSKMGKVEQMIRVAIPTLHTPIPDSPSLKTAFTPNNETFLQNGPVTLSMLQQPKQTTVQWVVDTTSNEVAREQLMQKLEGILSKTTTRLVNGNQSMTIRLAPEHLGTLHIKMQETQNGLVTKLIVHSKSAASLLEGGLANLKQTLAQANANMDKIEVVFLDQDHKLPQQHKGTNEENAQQRQAFKQDKQQDDANQSFEDVLLEELEIKIPEGERT
ncbi:flagellar hook-length control protein FliK [Sutcliffiella horikoshii]|uniref:flagellar hook-length control protein FliK n=1 Tax=Sutcliffiella horikoshii TaxID=79883 RepID=UPI001CFD83E2|nr:flagellar hook-length control protein FliK [Sutcliffiella horikoshii]